VLPMVERLLGSVSGRQAVSASRIVNLALYIRDGGIRPERTLPIVLVCSHRTTKNDSTIRSTSVGVPPP